MEGGQSYKRGRLIGEVGGGCDSVSCLSASRVCDAATYTRGQR